MYNACIYLWIYHATSTTIKHYSVTSPHFNINAMRIFYTLCTHDWAGWLKDYYIRTRSLPALSCPSVSCGVARIMILCKVTSCMLLSLYVLVLDSIKWTLLLLYMHTSNVERETGFFLHSFFFTEKTEFSDYVRR